MTHETHETVATRSALVGSPRWLKEVEGIDIIRIALAPVLDMSKWTAFMHRHAREWATGVTDVMPIPIQKYLAELRRKD